MTACGSPEIEAAIEADTSGGGSVDGGATTIPFHDGGPMPFQVTGDGFIEVIDDKDFGDMRGLRLVMIETTKPEIGKVYVWWMRTPKGKAANFGVLPYEDQPYKPDFTVTVGDPGDGSPPHIANFNGAFITYEDELDADKLKAPVGPLVWSAEQAVPAWSHVNHVLTEWEGNPGLIQQANGIIGALKAEFDLAKEALKAKKPKLARMHVENMHTLLIGEDDAKDLPGEGDLKVGLSPFKGGLANAKSPLREAVKHAGFAKDVLIAIKADAHKVEEGYVKMNDASAAFNAKVVSSLDSMDTFAAGAVADFKDVNEAATNLLSNAKKAVTASVILSRIELKR